MSDVRVNPLVDRFMEDLFDAICKQDGDTRKFSDLTEEDKKGGREIAQLMLDRGWHK